MHIDPAIAALRADPGLQRRAQAAAIEACAAWREKPASANVLADLVRYGAGAPLESCHALEALLTGPGEAERLASTLSAGIAALLAAHPLAQPALRHGFDGTVATLQLARCGRAHLVLMSREPGAWTYDHASFSDAVRFDAVLAGAGEGRIVRRGAGAMVSERVSLRPGARLAFDLAGEALQIETVSRRLVWLRLQRFAAEPEPSCDYRLSDGHLAHRTSGSLSASRHAMMVAVLGRMRRTDSVSTMADIAREPGDDTLRWDALRETLALDTAQGFAALLAIARDSNDPLAAPAGSLRAQLIEAHPQLSELEASLCRE